MSSNSGRGHPKRIQDEAADWRARMSEPTSEAEVEAFEEWLEAAPAHAQAYHEYELLWSTGEKVSRDLLAEPTTASKWGSQPAFGLAVAILVTVVVGLWLATSGGQPAYAAVSNPGPSIRIVRLVDGTEIVLDAATELAVALEDDARTVRISAGRARFTVAADEERPFSVATPDATVTARTTVFDVAISGGEASVFVIEGIVDIATSAGSAGAGVMALRQGEAIDVRGGQLRSTTVSRFEARWPAGRLPFDKASLTSVVEMANRGSDPDIALQGDAVGNLKVTGVFDIRDTCELARKLAATHDLRLNEGGGLLVLTR